MFLCKSCKAELIETYKSKLPGVSRNLKCTECDAIFIVIVGSKDLFIKNGLTQVFRTDAERPSLKGITK